MRKRKVTYPPPKTSNRPAPASGLPIDTPYVRPTVATIDLNAGKGRAGLSVGGRVRIAGTGLYAGEIAIIEKLVAGVIPQAVVRTEAGKTRQVRTIDLEPVGPGAAAQTTSAGQGNGAAIPTVPLAPSSGPGDAAAPANSPTD